MRLPTNNIALAAVGFAAVVVLVPVLMVAVYVLRFLKVGANPLEFFFAIVAPRRTPAEEAGEPSTLRSLFDALCQVRLL